MQTYKKPLIVLSLAAFLSIFASSVSASHTWGSYHWGRTTSVLPLELGDNVSSTWDDHLALASSDWNFSDVLDTKVVTGKTTSRKCRPTPGRAEICNYRYGNNGWLGIAQIWVSGDHITQALVKMNDTYFNTAKYNTVAWKNLVMCQEVGHVFGLGHQDENFSNPNLDTCMDYTSDPESNQHPNIHDYELLNEIYAHLDAVDTFTTSSSTSGDTTTGPGKGKKQGELNTPSSWGKQVSEKRFVKQLSKDSVLITDVFWVDEQDHEHV